MTKTTIKEDFLGEQITLHRFTLGHSIYPPVLLIHGSIENGKIFYSSSGKGLAPFLAKHGFDVFVVDLRGKGESTPAVSSKSKASQTDTISQEIPFWVKRVKEITGSDSIHFGAHSWGGVLFLAAYTQFYQEWNVKSMVFFGTKRRIGIRNFNKFLTIDLGWSLLGTIATKISGYLPAVKLKMGSDNEPAKFYLQTNRWVYSKKWIDPETGVNYADKLSAMENKPPVCFYTGINDKLLGHPEDVKRLASEAGLSDNIHILSKQNGNLRDYDHINILTHPDALNDHFPQVVEWYRKYS